MLSSDLVVIFSQKLSELKNKNGGSISFEDVSEIMVQIIEKVNENFKVGSVIYKELESIRDTIDEAKGETLHIIHDDEDSIPDASSQVTEAINQTESAANDIIDAASEIMEAAPDNEKIQALSMKIMENCDFGDLVRQRLQKVHTHLENVESRMDKLFETLKIERKEAPKDKVSDGIVLAGPQLSSDTPSQDDIDALFDSL